ncbi:MAG: hypothetical protein KIT45_00960 [Fimbriimonadia bacterium]|nr:hypothetical protein [Fimbriimonadia bacterium]
MTLRNQQQKRWYWLWVLSLMSLIALPFHRHPDCHCECIHCAPVCETTEEAHETLPQGTVCPQPCCSLTTADSTSKAPLTQAYLLSPLLGPKIAQFPIEFPEKYTPISRASDRINRSDIASNSLNPRAPPV